MIGLGWVDEMSEEKSPLAKALIIFCVGIMCFIIGLVGKITRHYFVGGGFIFLGIYAVYRGIVELTTTGQGVQMSNAYKVLISAMCLVTLVYVANVYVMAGFWTNFAINFADNVIAIVDGIIKLVEYFKGNSVELFV